MKHLFIATMVALFSNACFAGIDCTNAVESDALIYCSQKGLQDSESNFQTMLNRLSASTWIPKKSVVALVANYKRSSIISKTVCTSIFPNGRLRDMYINDCVSTQLDKLTDGIKSFLCTQQDADGCR